MKPVRIFRHVSCEGPGYLGHFLERHNIYYELICIDEGVPVPQEIDNISGLVFMGGSMNVTDPLEWIAEEQQLIKKAIENNIPVLGICLGAQLMSTALGGTITHDENMEIGWHDVEVDIRHKNNKWLQDLPEKFTPFHWHADTFSIPENATALMHSQCRKNQAFVINNSLAVQFHLEMTVDMVKQWVKLFGSDLEQPHRCTQDSNEILNDLEKRVKALQHNADIFFGKWIKGLATS